MMVLFSITVGLDRLLEFRLIPRDWRVTERSGDEVQKGTYGAEAPLLIHERGHDQLDKPFMVRHKVRALTHRVLATLNTALRYGTAGPTGLRTRLYAHHIHPVCIAGVGCGTTEPRKEVERWSLRFISELGFFRLCGCAV